MGMQSPMPRLSRRRLLQAAAGVFVAPLARAQGLSSRPIRVILGQTAATTPDLIYPMVQWVEQGSAPGQLPISYTVSGSSFSRPVYPYPDIPRYNGTGDPNSAASFHPVPSPGAHYTDWIGNYLFFQPVGGRRSGRSSCARPSWPSRSR